MLNVPYFMKTRDSLLVIHAAVMSNSEEWKRDSERWLMSGCPTLHIHLPLCELGLTMSVLSFSTSQLLTVTFFWRC